LGKNIYSLALFDEVVDAVDKMADERCTSRSGLINEILSDYLSCPTPETRIRDVFSCMEKRFENLGTFQLRSQPSGTLFSVRSSLRYRYRPTVRYALELYRRYEPLIGELRVSLRTQNEDLLRLSEDFFRLRDALEEEWISGIFPDGKVPFEFQPGRCTRQLQYPQDAENRTSEKIAEALLAYICEFDSEMKAYFSGADSADEIEAEVEKQYRNYLKSAVII
jgi:hypothetical protein